MDFDTSQGVPRGQSNIMRSPKVAVATPAVHDHSKTPVLFSNEEHLNELNHIVNKTKIDTLGIKYSADELGISRPVT